MCARRIISITVFSSRTHRISAFAGVIWTGIITAGAWNPPDEEETEEEDAADEEGDARQDQGIIIRRGIGLLWISLFQGEGW